MIVLLQEPFECVKVLYTFYAIYDCMCSLSMESNSLFLSVVYPAIQLLFILCVFVL